MGSLLSGGCGYLACSGLIVWMGWTATLVVVGALMFLLDDRRLRARHDASLFRSFADAVAIGDLGSAENVAAETLRRFDRDSTGDPAPGHRRWWLRTTGPG